MKSSLLQLLLPLLTLGRLGTRTSGAQYDCEPTMERRRVLKKFFDGLPPELPPDERLLSAAAVCDATFWPTRRSLACVAFCTMRGMRLYPSS